MTELIQGLLKSIFTTTTHLPDSNDCPNCGKTYKSYRGLSAHVTSAHPGAMSTPQTANQNDQDQVFQHTKELLKMLLLKRLMDKSISLGDGTTLALVIKSMLPYFKELGCTKYSVATFEFIAQQQIFLSEKMATAVRQERFVNNRGRSYTNIPVDLDVEHANKDFKENFRLSLGEPSQKVLDRLSKSQDRVKEVLDSFTESFSLQQVEARRTVNQANYLNDVKKIVDHLKNANVFTMIPNRALHSKQLNIAARDVLATMDLYKLRFWLSHRLSVMMDQPYYKC